MANAWFESVAEAQRRAKRRLPPSVYSSLIAGAEGGVTKDDNVAAFAELGFNPRVGNNPSDARTTTTIMGHELSMPVLISPTGVQAVHPGGESAIARAAAARGTAMGLSCFASQPLEVVLEANPLTLFQLYWIDGRDAIARRVERARAAGAAGLIVTLDWSFSHGRDWGSPAIPDRVNLRAMARFAPEALRRPRWLAAYLRSGHLPNLEVPNMASDGEKVPTFFEAYGRWMQTPPPTWEDLAWLRAQWDGPFMVKGVTRVEDARRVRDLGASALSVSNHGGNNLDGTPATIRLLSPIAEAVGRDLDVVLDGGVRRGSDVVKALALGARAVMLGRAALWGLAANGQAGVENVLDLLRAGLGATARGLGHAELDFGPADLLVPGSFSA